MERLTMTDAEIEEIRQICSYFDCPVKAEEDSVTQRLCDKICDEFQCDCPFQKMGQRLKAYEDAEEQGILKMLPVAIGSDVYFIPSKVNYDLNVLSKREENNRVYHQKVARITFTERGWYLECDKNLEYGVDHILVDKFYKETWFTTQEETEQALKQMGE